MEKTHCTIYAVLSEICIVVTDGESTDGVASEWTVARNEEGKPIGCATTDMVLMKYKKLKSVAFADLKDSM